jgi:Tfp pilus assembly protein PilX
MMRQSPPNRRQGDSGVALILVLLSLLVLTTLAAAMVFSARSETLASYNYRIGTQAEYVALAGVQKALNFFNSSSYVPLSPTNAASGNYYPVSTYATTPVNLYFTTAAPVTCTGNCTHSGSVQLSTTTGSSAYPPPSIILDAGGHQVDVVANWIAAMNDQGISDGVGGSGNYTVTASLLEYHTVNNAFYGVPASGCADAAAGAGICRQPFEVWQVKSTGTWNSNLGAGAARPTVQVVATISPIFIPYYGFGLYGLCSVSMSGTQVCTDSYNSSYGQYGGNATQCVSTTTGATNAQYANSGVGSNGGISLNGNVHVGGDVAYANMSSDSSCNTGFSGSTTNIAGSVLTSPPIPVPPSPDMTAWGYPTTSPAVQPKSGGSGNPDRVVNVRTKVTTPPTPPAGATLAPGGSVCPAGFSAYIESYLHNFSGGTNTYSNYNCVGVSGSGTSTDPYRLGDVAAGGGGGTPGSINLIGPSGSLASAIYVAINSISIGNNGVINTSYQAPDTSMSGNTFNPNSPAPTAATATPFVLDIKNDLSIVGGTANMNYNASTPGVPSPSYLTVNIQGTGTALSLKGQAQLNGMINVPNGDASLGGSGASGAFFGAILAKNVTDGGNYPVHYDLAAQRVSGQMFQAQILSVTRPKM